jgi:hypothetical protein
VEYFHLELDTHDVILAEGAPSETFVDDGSRGMFQNAASYDALYPGEMRMPPRYCAPRVEEGEALGAVRRRLIARARPAVPADAVRISETLAGKTLAPGPLTGHLDVAGRDLIGGWAWDAQRPDEPVALEILDNGAVIHRLAASDYRFDLEKIGIGDGRHGFQWRIPGGLAPDQHHVIAVRRAADGAELRDSPRIVASATGFDAPMERSLTGIIDGLRPGPEQDRVLSFIVAQAERLMQARADADSRRQDRQAWRDFQRRGGQLPASHASAHPPDPVLPAPIPRAPILRALVIDERLPDAARDGGSQAVLSHARALRSLGYQVSFVAAHDLTPDAAAVAALAAEAFACWQAPRYGSVEEVLRRQAGCFDVVYLHRMSMASAYQALVRQHCPHARILYSAADLDRMRLAGAARREMPARSRRPHAVLTHPTQQADWPRRPVPNAANPALG